MANPSPGLKAHPEHKVTLEHEGQHVRVGFAGETIADTNDAITVREADYEPVLYIPLADVSRRHLVPSAHRTHCPFKGEARYWNLTGGERNAENAAWAYDRPFDEVAEIAGHVAFYPDRVTITVD